MKHWREGAILAAAFCVALSLAYGDGLRSEVLQVTPTAATGTIAFTNTSIRGWVEEILIDSPASGCTSKVHVFVIPELSTMSNVDLVTNRVVSADFTARPRVDATDTGGTALTSDPPVQYCIVGESVVLSVTNNGTPAATYTNKAYKAVIKYRTPK